MAILNDDPNCGKATIGVWGHKECKPDYERMAAEARKCADKARKLMEAIYEYRGESRCSGKLAEMIGELHSEARMYDARYNQIIAEQEKEAEAAT